jgi:DNA replication licensing factor MCM7
VTVSGIFLPLRFEGFRAMKAGLISDTYLEISSLTSHKKSYTDFTFTPELLVQINEKAEEKDIYNQLASSIAPEIFGHEDVKKALLCLLVGGVSRTLGDGMKIRGDINILLMGDPGVAKSQLLKHISHVAPRGIYTTGKGSSGVGLTAAVLRDVTTGEVTLEGGALVLADQGICCIDEFDKMEDTDRTAIHEVMEQQTVSIAKAGITTTLNARTAVLAAANPVYGRWNRSIPAEKNLGIETALLSRFDLTFSLLDTPDEDMDEALARHITHVHRYNKHPALEFEPFAPEFMRAYVCRARQFEPFVPEHLTEHIVSQYVELRKEKGEEGRRTFVTARSLLAVLRLSQALARINFRAEVRREDVEEAQRLLWVAKQTGNEEDPAKHIEDPVSAIWGLIRAAHKSLPTGKAVSRLDINNKATARGYSAEQVEETIRSYTASGMIVDSYDSSKIMIAVPIVS